MQCKDYNVKECECNRMQSAILWDRLCTYGINRVLKFMNAEEGRKRKET